MGSAVDLIWDEARKIDQGTPKSPYTHWTLTVASVNDLPRSDALRALALAAEAKFAAPDPSVPRAHSLLTAVPFSPAVFQFLDIGAVNSGPQDPNVEPPRRVPLNVGLAPGDALVAAIDDGAFFAHQRFWHAPFQTRVVWAWIQGAPAPPPEDGIKSDLPFGREVTRDDISGLLQRHRLSGNRVDEEAIYREVGLIDPAKPHPQSSMLAQSHGMAVMDLLAGTGGPNAARLRPIWVSLPPSVTADTSGGFLPLFAWFAVEAILDRADRMIEAAERHHPGISIPVVINISYGLTAGPKDGTGLFERYLTERIEAWDHTRAPLSVFAPMGNTRLSRSHGRLDQPGEKTGLAWRLPPDDPTPSFLEIWGRRRARPLRPTLVLSLGDGEEISFERFDTYRNAHAPNDTPDTPPLLRAYASWIPTDLNDPDGPGREVLTLVAQPTRPARPGEPFLRPGDLALRVVSTKDTASWPLDLHVQRDDSLPGYRRRGRQSSLVDPLYRRRDGAGRIILEDPDPSGPVRREAT